MHALLGAQFNQVVLIKQRRARPDLSSCSEMVADGEIQKTQENYASPSSERPLVKIAAHAPPHAKSGKPHANTIHARRSANTVFPHRRRSAELMRGGNAYFIKNAKGNVVLMAENIKEHDRPWLDSNAGTAKRKASNA